MRSLEYCLHYICRGHGTACPCPPLAPLRLISLRQIACSSGGRAKHWSPTPFGLSCAAILLCDLSPWAARALTSRAAWRGALLASHRRAMFECKNSGTQNSFFKIVSRYCGSVAATNLLPAFPHFKVVSLDRAPNTNFLTVARFCAPTLSR